MKIGDLVVRKKPIQTTYERLHTSDGFGIILERGWGGSNPVHRCAKVFWFDRARTYDIAEALIKTAE
ncbi:MAG TPA: hypothetical protein EYQ00_08500 [Dehalococcoidia bacterium]|nr:hypothetical protein [Dehalococcoidia bacterium]